MPNQNIQEGIARLMRKQSSVFTLVILIGLCASIAMYLITAQGPGVSPDSTIYIQTARALLEGNGFFISDRPMTHYPPVFPLALAVVALFTGGDVLLAARLFLALLFGVNLILLALAVYMCTKHSLLAIGCVILLFLFSEPILSIYSMAWSEAPFIAFSMAGFILLCQHLSRPNLRHLILASLLIGVAATTRYIGIILFPTVALALFIFLNRSFRYKVRDILLFSGIACLPLVSWSIRNILVAQSATDRQLVFHPFSLSHVRDLIVNMYDFVLPIPISEGTKALQVGVVAILFVLAIRLLYLKTDIKQSTSSVRMVLPAVLIIYSVLYISFLFLSLSFFDAHTPVDHRLLLPVFFALIIACTSIIKTFSEVWSQKGVWFCYVFLILFCVSINAAPAISRAMTTLHNGSGYTDRYWKESASLAHLSRVPETMVIYSNGPDVIRFLTQRESILIPRKTFASTLSKNENYQEQMTQMVSNCEKGNALIVYLDRITWRWSLPSKKEIESFFTVPLAVAMEDGVIYGLSVMQNKAEQGATLDMDSAALHSRH